MKQILNLLKLQLSLLAAAVMFVLIFGLKLYTSLWAAVVQLLYGAFIVYLYRNEKKEFTKNALWGFITAVVFFSILFIWRHYNDQKMEKIMESYGIESSR